MRLCRTLTAAALLPAAALPAMDQMRDPHVSLRFFVQSIPREVEDVEREINYYSGLVRSRVLGEETIDEDNAFRLGIEAMGYAGREIAYFTGGLGFNYSRREIGYTSPVDEITNLNDFYTAVQTGDSEGAINASLAMNDEYHSYMNYYMLQGSIGLTLRPAPFVHFELLFQGALGGISSWTEARYTRLITGTDYFIVVEAESDDDYGGAWEVGGRAGVYVDIQPVTFGVHGGWSRSRSRLEVENNEPLLAFDDYVIINGVEFEEITFTNEGWFVGVSAGFSF